MGKSNVVKMVHECDFSEVDIQKIQAKDLIDESKGFFGIIVNKDGSQTVVGNLPAPELIYRFEAFKVGLLTGKK